MCHAAGALGYPSISERANGMPDKPNLTDWTQTKEGKMIGVYVTFHYDGDFDRDRVINVADKARTMFEGLPGLRFKFFTFDETQQRATNFYVWQSREAADGFFTDELREKVSDLYGVAPRIEFVEIAQVVDNSST
jgi:hypothetical protein